MVKEIKARRIYKMEDIKYNPENSRNSLLACIPVISIYFLIFEKDDLFVKYHSIIFSFVTILFVTQIQFLILIGVILLILAVDRVLKRKPLVLPFISQYVLKAMAYI